MSNKSGRPITTNPQILDPCVHAHYTDYSYSWQHTTVFKWLDESVTNIPAQENHFITVCSVRKLQHTNTKYQNEVLEGEEKKLEPLYTLDVASRTVGNETQNLY